MKKIILITLIILLQLSTAALLSNAQEVKLTTKKDAIAIVSAKDIIIINPNFENTAIENLKLFHFGKEVPFFIYNDSDGLLNSDDEIIFLGKRASGDTTWFEHYTDEEPFFLVISDLPSNERYERFQEVSSYAYDLKEVVYSEHLEKEKLLLPGYEDYHTETSSGELWAWDTLSPAISGSFKLPLLIPLSKSSNHNIQLKAYFISTGYNKNLDFNHNLKFIFNKDTILEKAYKGGQRYFEQFDISPVFVSSAYNLFEMKSFGYRDKDRRFIYPDDLAIDFFEIEAKSSPFARNGSSFFRIEEQKDNFKLSVPSFSNEKIFAIDSVNKRVAILDHSQSGTTISISSKSGEKCFSSISINDSLNFSNVSGIHIGTAKADDYSEIEFFSFSDFDEAENYIKSASKGTVIAISLNSQSITNNFKNALLALGSKLISQYQNGDAFSFACIKGETSPIFEDLQGFLSGFYEFLSHSNGKSFLFEKAFEGNENFAFQLNDYNSIEKASIYKVNESSIKNIEKNPELLIITHEKFSDFAKKYADFRAGKNSLSYDIVQVDDIYNEFNFGKKSPHPIKDYLKYCYKNKSPAPKYVVLIGGASWDARFILSSSFKKDYIPSYGKPVSDFWYSLLEGDDYVPELIVARIPLQSEEQGDIYLEKLKEYERTDYAPWQKGFLLLAGGSNAFERASFLSLMIDIARLIANSNLCADTTIINKKDGSAVAENEAGEIIRNVNEGKLWTIFFGHGSATLLDLDGWQAERLNNAGRYGLFSAFSCNTGAFAEPNVVSRNEDYLFTANRGFIAATSSTGVGFVDIQSTLLKRTIEEFIAGGNLTYLEAINKAKIGLSKNLQQINTILQYNFIGDPLVSLKISDKPNLYFVENSVEVRNLRNEKIIVESDSVVQISGVIFNQGRRFDDKIDFLLIREYSGFVDTLFMEFPSFCHSDAFTCFLDITNMIGMHKFWIIIDPENKTQSEDLANKIHSGTFEVLNTGLLPLDPLNLWNISAKKPTFRFINPLGNNSDFEYIFRIWDNPDTSSIPISLSDKKDIKIRENYIDWEPSISLMQNAAYWLEATAFIQGIKGESKSLFLSFRADDNNSTDGTAHWQVFGKDQLEQGSMQNLCFSKINGNDALTLDSLFLSYKIGAASEYSKRYIEIIVGDTIYAITPPTRRGFNALVLSSENFSPKNLKQFDTWGKGTKLELDSTGVELVSFLRDSIEKGDYLLLGTSDESTRLLTYHKKLNTSGSVDTLQAVLREYGSVLIDSIEFGSTFVLVARKGYPEFAKELWSKEGDSCRLQGRFVKHLKNGTYASPNIGPAKNWLNLSSVIPRSDDSVLIEIIGLNKNSFPTSLKKLYFKNESIDLSDISALDYPYLRLVIHLERESIFENPYFSGIRCSFVPTPELAIVKSQTKLSENEVLRADELSILYQVENISKRVGSSPVKSVLSNISVDGKSFLIESNFPVILKNDKNEIEFNFDSEQLIGKIDALFEVNPENELSELYSFNNRALNSYTVYEDRTKPQVKLFIDEQEIEDGSCVPIRPSFKVELYDNSRLAIQDEDNLKVRINSRMQLADNTEDYTFLSKGKEIPLKAVLSFIPDTLDWDDNVITVYASDASGNRDTLRLTVFCSLNGLVKDLLNYPNPFAGQTTFSFKIEAPSQDNIAIIDIYDIFGRKIKTIRKAAKVGVNSLLWDGKNEEGTQVATGVYYYMLKLEGNTYFEPTSSTLQIVR